MKKYALLLAIVGVAVYVFMVSRSHVDQGASSESAATLQTGSELLQTSGTALAGRDIQAGAIELDHQPDIGHVDSLNDFARIKSEAEQGSPEAQRKLAMIYERCMFYSLSPERYVGTLQAMIELAPESAPEMKRVIERTAKRCAMVDGGKFIPLEAYQLWLKQAADAGDLIARLRIASRSTDGGESLEYQQLVDAAISSREPEAIFEAGQVLARSARTQGLGMDAYPGGVDAILSEFAWGIAACRMGMQCTRASYVMDNLCTNSLQCTHHDYEGFVRTEMLPAGQLKRLDAMVSEVMKLVGDARKDRRG